jgi:hypothetical protein
LLGAEYRPEQALAIGLSALLILVEAIGDRLHDLMPLLVLPLEPSPRLDVGTPARAEYARQSTPEPPSVYILARDAFKCWDAVEDYRLPLDDEELAVVGGGILVAYYRCFRDFEARANGWEYARCVYVGYFPSNMVLRR